MKTLNYYFEFPSYFDKDALTYSESSYQLMNMYTEICLSFIKNNKEIKFNLFNTWVHQHIILKDHNKKYCTNTNIIENPENGKFFVISIMDKIYPIFNIWDLTNCMGVFASFGVHNNDVEYKLLNNANYIPATNTTVHKEVYDDIEKLYKLKNERSILDRPFFIGGFYGMREKIYENDKRFDFYNINNQRMNPHEFIKKMNSSKINIDINGVAEISARTLDIMGLGTALIRPKLTVQFHNPLIPDYHYAALRCDDQSNLKDLTDSYIERYNELKRDPDFVEFLSINGRKWYEENATIESCVRIFNEIIDLNKLF